MWKTISPSLNGIFNMVYIQIMFELIEIESDIISEKMQK